MANAGPDTNGSQFFVVLPGWRRPVWHPHTAGSAQVTEGHEVVDAIGGLGGPDGAAHAQTC